MIVNKTRFFLQKNGNFQQFKRFSNATTVEPAVQNVHLSNNSQNEAPIIFQKAKHQSPEIIDWKKEMTFIKEMENQVGFEKPQPARAAIPTFNFLAYLKESETLQKLVGLGVNLSKLEKKKGIPQFILKLDFERDMKDHLLFLKDVGVPADHFGWFLTKNPLIFKESIEDLHTRIYYLESKKFKMEQITQIVSRNPHWLMFSTKRIDNRLGFFQKNFELAGNEIRLMTLKEPRLVTYNMEHIRMSSFSVREEMGFNKEEVKSLLLDKPRIWMISHPHLLARFDYVHRTMKIPHEQLVQIPELLLTRVHRTKERHEFLKYLKRDQYNPREKLYISPKTLVEASDTEFVENLCESTMETFNNFLKTL